MIFEGLAEKLQGALQKLKNKGKLTEKDVQEAMREVKLALLEADVNFKVVKEFINKVKERAVGAEVMESLTPGQQVIKIVNEELTALMGTVPGKLTFSSSPPSIFMLVGLQGSGKTTTSGKLGGYLKKMGKRPLLVAADIYRPAAIKQLEVVGSKLDIPVFSMGDKLGPVNIAKAAVEHAHKHGNDTIIIDTAGRLHIDEELMEELVRIKEAIVPHEILLVVDAMTGQDAVNVAKNFNEKLGIDGVILTKLDGDTRGGAALSVRAVTQKPIKFAGMASRILGMGDVLTLIEKAQANFDEKKARELEKKIKNQEFDFDDFLEQLQQMKNMGPMNQLLEMIPVVNRKQLKDLEIDEKEFAHIEAIIQSMTNEERRNPSIINGSRRKRIARGSGVTVNKVNSLLKQFAQMKKMMKQFAQMEKSMKKGGKMKIPFFGR